MTTASDTHWAVDRLRAAPGVRALSAYQRGWLVKDIVAGDALTTLLVPQGHGVLTRTIDPGHFYPTVETAVAAFRRHTGAEWAAGVSTDVLGEG